MSLDSRLFLPISYFIATRLDLILALWLLDTLLKAFFNSFC